MASTVVSAVAILMAMQSQRLTLIVPTVLGLAACGTVPVPVNYAPSSILSNSGATGVAQFTYAPADPDAEHPVAPDQIRNTAMGDIHIDCEVGRFVRDAVFAELRFTGIRTDDRTRLLNGHIEEFLIDDLGYSVDWTLRIKYWLVDTTTRKVLFVGTKDVRRRTAKFANPFGALNETIKLNAEALMRDPAFKRAINAPPPAAALPAAALPPTARPEPPRPIPVQSSS